MIKEGLEFLACYHFVIGTIGFYMAMLIPVLKALLRI